MIFTLTLNPAVDYTVISEKLTPGEINISKKSFISAGGKGINVSVVLKELGIDSVAMGFVGGFTGDKVISELKKAGVKTDFVLLKNKETRINIKISELSDGDTEINSPGPDISDEEFSGLFKKLEDIKENDILIISGSLPKSAPSDLYAKIISSVKKQGAAVVLDAAGDAMKCAVTQKPLLVKPNEKELEEFCGFSINTEKDAVAGAKILKNAGAENVLVSRGKKGALLLAENQKVYILKAPVIKPLNCVCAGDSMLAGFVAGLLGIKAEEPIKQAENKNYNKETLKESTKSSGAFSDSYSDSSSSSSDGFPDNFSGSYFNNSSGSSSYVSLSSHFAGFKFLKGSMTDAVLCNALRLACTLGTAAAMSPKTAGKEEILKAAIKYKNIEIIEY